MSNNHDETEHEYKMLIDTETSTKRTNQTHPNNISPQNTAKTNKVTDSNVPLTAEQRINTTKPYPLGERFMDNLKSGITVGLVNICLCISLAVASGSTPGRGIISGMYAGIVSGLIGGSHFNIIGPTGALSSFLKKLILKYGEDALPFSCFVTGIYCFLARLSALDLYIDVFPAPVVEGFTVGVALILILNQVGPALGNENLNPETHIHNAHKGASLIDNLINEMMTLDTLNVASVLMFFVFFFGIGAIGYKFNKFPVVIVGTAIGILYGFLQSIGYFGWGIRTLHTKFGELDLNFFNYPTNLWLLVNPMFYIDCIPTAVIAILETLISAKIADKMTRTRFEKETECLSLGVSNILVGAAGGVPVTAALARTSLNVKTGATNKMSALINAICVFILSVFFFKWFKYLPIPVIGSIVCVVAFKMVDFNSIFHFYRQDMKSFLLIMLGGFVSLIADPTVGIIVGMLVYFFMFTTQFMSPFYEVIFTKSKKENDKFAVSNLDQFLNDVPVGDKPNHKSFIVYRFVGVFNYMNIDEHEKKIIEVMNSEPEVCVILSLRYLYVVDIDSLDSLKTLLDNVKLNNADHMNRILLSGISKNKIESLKDPEWFKNLIETKKLSLSEQFDVQWDHEMSENPHNVPFNSNCAWNKDNANAKKQILEVKKVQERRRSSIRKPDRPDYNKVNTRFKQMARDSSDESEISDEDQTKKKH